MSDCVLVDRIGSLGIVTLNRPARLNAVDDAITRALPAAIEGQIASPEVRAILIAANGRAFCAGADIDEMNGPSARRGGDTLRDHFNPMISRMVGSDKPIVAAVNGACAGVGCAIALAADLVVAGESAIFIQAFVRIGAVPDAGNSWMLPRVIGRGRALAMMLLGNEISAQTALDWGMVHQVCADHELAATAQSLAQNLARGPTLAYAAVKRLVQAAALSNLEDHLGVEAKEQDRAFETSDYVEGVRAFIERRRAKFTAS